MSPDVLQPRNSWRDKVGYDKTASDLRTRFEENVKQFEAYVDAAVIDAGIRAVD